MPYKTGNPGLNDKTFASLPRPLAIEERMTLQGTVNKSFLLLVVLLATALWTWARYFGSGGNPASVMVPMMVGVIGGLIIALIISFKPTMAPRLAIVYAALEGLALGGISAQLQQRYPGIPIQAVGLTCGVMAAMLLAYTMRIIRVTERFKSIVVAATGAIMLVYLVSFVLSLFHVNVSFMNSASPLSLGISLVIIAVAALNLVLDFSFIEGGVNQGAPRYMEWYGAFALLVTLVWLYLEILRFLAKARQR